LIIIQAAQNVQSREHWSSDVDVKRLMFSSHWVRGFLTRAKMRRRKITTDDKVLPSEKTINEVMAVGQEVFWRKGHTYDTNWNMDETGLNWCSGPKYIFVPGDQSRALNIGIDNDKYRITAALTVNANGRSAPLFMIIRHSVSSEAKPDQTTMRTVKNLFEKNDGYGKKHGWELKTWVRTLEIYNKAKKLIKAEHRVNYLIHTGNTDHKATGDVITSQHKAWNDTVRMCMWLDLIMAPIKKDTKMLLWMDNCGSHLTLAVVKVMEEIEIDLALYPKNMTGIMQVLDLVVNGPVKAHTRTLRANRLYDYFNNVFKALYEGNIALPSLLKKK
jgi:hypothetical protein